VKYLLDTNALLFVFSAPSKLSVRARRIVRGELDLSVSVVSFWEIAIKQSIGKLQFNMTIPNLESLCISRNIQILSLGSTAIERIKALPTIHGDPFDRLIIAQAQMEDMTIVTCDKIMPQYPVKTVW
jgi:PIN domain nuclease of toxin-antitoxin system